MIGSSLFNPSRVFPREGIAFPKQLRRASSPTCQECQKLQHFHPGCMGSSYIPPVAGGPVSDTGAPWLSQQLLLTPVQEYKVRVWAEAAGAAEQLGGSWRS